MTDIESALAKVATASFLENMGELQFLALSGEDLIAFAFRNRDSIPQEAMNLAWSELMRRRAAREAERSAALERDWPGLAAVTASVILK